MERLDKTFEFDCPVHAAYNQWTQFEEFPRWMGSVKQVRQVDDTHQHWTVRIAGKEKEFDTEIFDQVPDQHISWRATSGVPNRGTARFEKIGDNRTRVQLQMEYEPQTFVEKAADAVGIVSAYVEGSVQKFKKALEERGRETGAWRGEVHGGEQTGAGGATRTSGTRH
jgi:uncharacterized membrane protein